MAHAPLGSGDNESFDKATVIPDQTKSWAIYAELHSDGDAQYYTLNITTGQKIHAMLFKSMRSEESGFTPRRARTFGAVPTYVWEKNADVHVWIVLYVPQLCAWFAHEVHCCSF
jgi:hypothetical protein